MQELKFLMPAFGTYGLLCADGVLDRATGRWVTAARTCLLIFSLCAVARACREFYTAGVLKDKSLLALRLKKPDRYISENTTHSELLRFCNTELPRNALIFSTAESALFYLERNYIAATGPSSLLDPRSCQSTLNFLARLKELGVTHVLLPSKPPSGIQRLETFWWASRDVLFKNLNYQHFRTLYDDGGVKIAAVEYPDHLPAYNALETADPLVTGDIILESGNLPGAVEAYEKASKLGIPAAKVKWAALQAMTPLEKGDFYLAKAKHYETARGFLKSALNEYAAVSQTSADAALVADRRKDVHAYGMEKAKHIWSHLTTYN
jgi:hypothetical protein